MVLSFARKGYLACVLSMLAIGMSHGQSKLDSIQHLDEVTVTARSFSFKEVIPSQKLSGKELQNLNSHTVADALRYFSGVQLKDYGGVGGIKTVNIRSMGTNHMGVFYDGIELSNAQNGQVDLGMYSLDNIEEILEVAYGVMIARGDLGIEVPQERIPGIQRVLIRKCILAKKPVIVATQMLHTMINNPRPTRAEVTDIANAIYYRTDALMLSGETAYGKYPVEAVKTMTKIAAQAEKDKLEENDIRIPLDENSNDVTAFLAKQAVKATSKLKIRAIITDSYSGRTARNLAAFRGKYPVLAICYKEKTMRHLALSYGVEAIYMPELANGQEYYFAALRRLLKEGRLQPTDMVGYLSSGKAGTQTSFLEINVVEDALKHAGETVLPNNNRYL